MPGAFLSAGDYVQAQQWRGRMIDAVDDAIGGHRRENAVRGRGMKSGVLRDLLEAQRLGMLRQDVEQLHHALDHLDRILRAISGLRARGRGHFTL